MKHALKIAAEEPNYIAEELIKLEPLYLNLLQGISADGKQISPHMTDNTAVIKAILDACAAYKKTIEALHKLDCEIYRYMKN